MEINLRSKEYEFLYLIKNLDMNLTNIFLRLYNAIKIYDEEIRELQDEVNVLQIRLNGIKPGQYPTQAIRDREII